MLGLDPPCRRLLLCTVGVLLAAVSTGTPAEVEPSRELIFCYENENVRPWRTRDGSGLNFELLNRVAESLRIRIRYVGEPWKRCLHELGNNVYDGAIGASFRPERLGNGFYPGTTEPIAGKVPEPDVGKSLYVERYVVVRRKGSLAEWNGRQFLHLAQPVGAPLGYSVVGELRSAGVQVDDGALTAEAVLRKLALARIDIAVLLHGELGALLNGLPGLRDRIEVLPIPFAEKPYYVIFSRRFVHADAGFAARLWATIAHERTRPDWKEREREVVDGAASPPR